MSEQTSTPAASRRTRFQRPAAGLVHASGIPSEVKAPPLQPEFFRDFFDGKTQPLAMPVEDLFAGALPATVSKIPMKTSFGNFNAFDTSVPIMELPRLTDGSVTDSWTPGTGTGVVVVTGDLTIGEGPRNNQRRKGTAMAAALNDDNWTMGLLGDEWREFRVLNNTTVPGGALTLVPARDTHCIFLFRDDSSAAFFINLALTNIQPGMKFMFVNLSAAETAGTNEQQTITVSAAGGTFTVSFGGQTTAPLAFNISAGALRTALGGLSSIGGTSNINVTGTAPYTLTFQNALGNTNVAAVTTDATLLTGGANTAVVATTVPGVAAIGQMVIVANGTTIAGNAINRLTLSRGAVVVLQSVPAGLGVGSDFIILQKAGTVA